MINRESCQLNYPAKEFFEKKLKCAFSTSEFRFTAGKLDVLAYNREQKCFHVAEGKYAKRISSVGHAVGQLIAYISMLQEAGYDFLNSISKKANLYLTDFAEFLENKSIKVCFYIVLPSKLRDKLIVPTELMLKNIGSFGDSIGILFADKNKCVMHKSPIPVSIKIRRIYKKEEFLDTVKYKFLSYKAARNLEARSSWSNIIQFAERDGNPCLHFEVWIRKRKKIENNIIVEVAFHLEWGKGWLKNPKILKRANKIRRIMRIARSLLKKAGYSFKYQHKWGKAWSRLYTYVKTKGIILETDDLDNVLANLRALADSLLPRLEQINWGRKQRRKEIDEASELPSSPK